LAPAQVWYRPLAIAGDDSATAKDRARHERSIGHGTEIDDARDITVPAVNLIGAGLLTDCSAMDLSPPQCPRRTYHCVQNLSSEISRGRRDFDKCRPDRDGSAQYLEPRCIATRSSETLTRRRARGINPGKLLSYAGCRPERFQPSCPSPQPRSQRGLRCAPLALRHRVIRHRDVSTRRECAAPLPANRCELRWMKVLACSSDAS
jgi:hypothetical protein